MNKADQKLLIQYINKAISESGDERDLIYKELNWCVRCLENGNLSPNIPMRLSGAMRIQWESQKRNPNFDNAIELADALARKMIEKQDV